ncbi:MAG: hypothetical protein JNG86_08740, partial [Verrucomicrobiaceae bacterium]|nr:hypothetical protein [Verrucomicrobiaceae bacterium]
GINSYDGWSNLNVYTGTAYPGSGLTTVYPYNETGLHQGASFLSTERLARPPSASAGNIDNFTGWHFLKTMPPVLAGSVFCIYRKPDGVTTELDVYRDVVTGGAAAGHHANWVVNGRTVLRHPPSLFVSSTPSPLKLPFRTKSLYIQSCSTAEPPSIPQPVYGVDLNDKNLLPSNLPVVPSTTGPVSSGGDLRYQGYLNVIKNDNNTGNSLWHFQDREKAAGRTDTVTIDVAATFNSATEAYWIAQQSTPTYPPPGWPSGYDSKLKVLFIKLDSAYLKNMRVYGVIDQIIFVGQSSNASFEAAAGLKPVIITVMPSGPRGRWVRDIRFERENARRHVLAFQDDLGRTTDLSWVNNPIAGTDYRWRCVLVNEYQTLMFNMPATLTQNVRWIGGVMTNWTVKRRAAGGTNASRLTFAPDTDSTVPQTAPAGQAFATFLPRDAWQETLFTP